MTTATLTDVLADLAARVEKEERTRAEAEAAGAEFEQMRQQVEALQEQHRKLHQEDPESFDHNGQPKKSSSEAGKVAKQLADLDLGDAQARYLHATQIQERAEQSTRDFVAAHYHELLEAVEPEAEAVTAKLQRAGEGFHAALLEYLGVVQKIEGWRGAAAVRNHDLRHVRSPALEHASGLVKTTKQFTQPAPSPLETQ